MADEGGSSSVAASSDASAAYSHDRRVIIYPVRTTTTRACPHSHGAFLPCDHCVRAASQNERTRVHVHCKVPVPTTLQAVPLLTQGLAPQQAYINSKIATSKGRKMPLAHCCEHPTVFEMVEVLKHLGYEAPLIEVRATEPHATATTHRRPAAPYAPSRPPQDKTHPRSDYSQRGRVRVQLKDPITGDPTVEDIRTSTTPARPGCPSPPATASGEGEQRMRSFSLSHAGSTLLRNAD